MYASSNETPSRTQFTPNDPYLGTVRGQPSLYLGPLYDQYIMINDLLRALRAGRGGARYAAVPRLRARD